MGRSIDTVIARLPKARRERVEAKAARLARDMIEHADSLGDIRVHTRQGEDIVLQNLGDLRKAADSAGNARRAARAKAPKKKAA